MADYNTLQKRRNLVVGAFTLVACLAFIWILGRFRDLPLWASQANSFYVKVNFHNAPGVQQETPVQFCGYQIGRVVQVSPPRYVKDTASGRSWHEVGVTLAIDKQYKNIPSNVDIKLMKRGLGSSYIEIQANEEEPAQPADPSRPETVFLCSDMVLTGSAGMNSEFFPPEVQKKIEDLVDSVGALARNTNQIIGDQDNQTNIKKTLNHVAAAAEAAGLTLKSVQQFSDTSAEQVAVVAENLNAALKEFQQAVAKINEGQGSAGKLINDGRLYENLLDSSQELEMALEQIKKWAADAREKGIRIKW